MQQVGHVGGRARSAAHCPPHDLQIEADLALEDLQLPGGGAAHRVLGVLAQRVVHAGHEGRDAERPLEVDPDHRVGRRVGLLLDGQLAAQHGEERRLAGVAGAEDGDVGLRLQREGDLPGEVVHADDLGRVIERAVPDEGVESHADMVAHKTTCM
jgi:hypothetical protein